MSKNYGYGIVATDDMMPKSTQHILNLLHHAPSLEKSCLADLNSYLEDNPDMANAVTDIPVAKCLQILLEMDYEWEDFKTVLPIIQAVIYETEGINLCHAQDVYDDKEYLAFTPRYPWYLAKNERDITQISLRDIVMKYLSMVCDAQPDFTTYEWDE